MVHACVQNDLPDGAVLVEVDEDDITPDTALSFSADSDIQMPLTTNGSHKSTFFERRKEKGRRSADYFHG